MERRKRRKLTTKNNQKKKDISPFRFSKKRKLDGCSNFCPMADVSLFSFDDICFVNIAESHFVVEESKKSNIGGGKPIISSHETQKVGTRHWRTSCTELWVGWWSLGRIGTRLSLSLPPALQPSPVVSIINDNFSVGSNCWPNFSFFFADLSPAAAAPLVRPRFEFWAGEKTKVSRGPLTSKTPRLVRQLSAGNDLSRTSVSEQPPPVPCRHLQQQAQHKNN